MENKEFVPAILEIFFSLDLIDHFEKSDILSSIKNLRISYELPPVRIRDDEYLKNDTFVILINGVRVTGYQLGDSSSFKEDLIREFENVIVQNLDMIKNLVELKY